ncbi:glycosyltransferase family 2 protein [Acidisoma sp. C75]
MTDHPAEAECIFTHERQALPSPDLVTVAISLFNYARFLPDCLGSVAAQRHAALDLVIVDDRSEKDDSLAVARAWMEAHVDRFERMTLLRHRRNQGLARSRNTAFAAARGTHVFVLDADNMLYPRAIGRLLRAVQADGTAAAYSQIELFGDKSRIGIADVWQPEWLKTGNYIDAMALVSRDAWRDCGGYSHIEGGWEDYDFWCKMIEQGYEALFVPEILCRYRVHGTSMLRTESARSYDSMFVEMTMRHPWMRLAPIAPEFRLP